MEARWRTAKPGHRCQVLICLAEMVEPNTGLIGPRSATIWRFEQSSAHQSDWGWSHSWPFLYSVIYFRAHKHKGLFCVLWRTLTWKPPSNLPLPSEGEVEREWKDGWHGWRVSETVAGNCYAQGWFKVLIQNCHVSADSSTAEPRRTTPHGGSAQPDPGAAVLSVLPRLLSHTAKELS